MHNVTAFIVVVVGVSLIFDYVNGFHDTANAIATVVSTRVLTPRAAIIMAAILNFAGALMFSEVAKTIAGGLVDKHDGTQGVVLAAVTGAIVWNLITWRFGIPSSSSHALIGGLVGAAVVHHGSFATVVWQAPGQKGLLWKVLIPLIGSPLAGFVLGFGIMAAIFIIFRRTHPGRVSGLFRHLQVVSAGAMAYTHGLNDAQKSMGIITMALVSAKLIPSGAHGPDVPTWVKLACAIMMALGTAAGGWRIIKTMGHKIVRLEPVHGFAAESSAAIVLFTTAHFGMPVSTTHTISGSIFGVGASKRLSAVRWGVAQSMIIAWILTLPAAAAMGAVVYALLRAAGAS